jgi:hypothetical protein
MTNPTLLRLLLGLSLIAVLVFGAVVWFTAGPTARHSFRRLPTCEYGQFTAMGKPVTFPTNPPCQP